MKRYKILDSTEIEEKLPVKSTMLLRAGHLHICVVRTERGVYAVQNECSHRGASLREGTLNIFEEIVCPLHAYRFCLKTGEERTGKKCPDLRTYRLEKSREGLFIFL